jgi:hypothetical protein
MVPTPGKNEKNVPVCGERRRSRRTINLLWEMYGELG